MATGDTADRARRATARSKLEISEIVPALLENAQLPLDQPPVRWILFPQSLQLLFHHLDLFLDRVDADNEFRGYRFDGHTTS